MTDQSQNNFSVIYQLLFNHYGPQHWWPGETPFEVTIGAILTQNTNWSNVEKAITNLKQADALSCDAIVAVEQEKLEEMIRPSGYFRQKAERLKLFCWHLADHHQGSIEQLVGQPLEIARRELLSLKGIGPETADSILLYAGNRLSFVVDAYTNRVFARLGILKEGEKYEQVRQLFMSGLPEDVQLYNEYHALIVIHCKDFCRKKPLCDGCPCRHLCEFTRDA